MTAQIATWGTPFRKAALNAGGHTSVCTLRLLEKRSRERQLSTDVFEKKSCVKNGKGNGDYVNVLKKIGLDELRIIYKEHIREDFPRGERRPFFCMEKLQKAGQYDCYGYYRDDNLIAYACYILTQNGSYALLDYFAVVPELRGKGIGSEFLRSLNGNVSAKCGVFIEAESPDSAKTEEERQTRERRIHFYPSNGAERTNSKCLLFGVDYNILFISTCDAVDTQEKGNQRHAVEELYHELYGRAYGRLCKPYEDHKPN
ncbi:MAG: GNAT family N-acetyltransferase [Clostridiales bacterium]|nr:GNAT family N-acetyltransferase [Clostridiales bacterium]